MLLSASILFLRIRIINFPCNYLLANKLRNTLQNARISRPIDCLWILLPVFEPKNRIFHDNFIMNTKPSLFISDVSFLPLLAVLRISSQSRLWSSPMNDVRLFVDYPIAMYHFLERCELREQTVLFFFDLDRIIVCTSIVNLIYHDISVVIIIIQHLRTNDDFIIVFYWLW